MFFIDELIYQFRIPPAKVNSYIDKNNIKLNYYTGSDGKFLGSGISDEDAKKLFKEEQNETRNT